jgi:hypothetical protein
MSYHLIFESVGLANRKPGQIFRNTAGDELIFQRLDFYPNSGQADSFQEIEQFLQDQETMLGQKIRMSNLPNPRMLGVGIAEFQDAQGRPVYFGRYFQQISPARSQNNWPNKEIPGGYLYQGTAARKTASGLMPQDVLTRMNSLSPDDILDQVIDKFGEDSALTEVTRKLVNGSPLPIRFDGTGIEFTAFRDYFCEILQPIAMIRGQFKGNAGSAAEKFLGGSGFEDCVIDFSSGKSTGLYDSLLTDSNGRQIKISTKGGSGAKASVKNLLDVVNEVEKTNKKLLSRYKKTVELVKKIQEAGQADSPVVLALEFDLINAREAKVIREMRTNSDVKLTPKLQALYNSKPGRDPSKEVPFFRMLAALAVEVSDLVNENTDFPTDARDILKNGALVQVYTTVTRDGSDYILDVFDTKYPNEDIRGVYLDPQKVYYNTGIKGNFTFKIDTTGSGAPDLDEPVAEPTVSDTEEIPDVPQRTDIRPRGARGRERRGGDEENLGRGRR